MNILNFFYQIGRELDGSRGIPEGIRCHFISTNYDYLIESILDNILGEEDSITLYQYRGITPITVCEKETPMVCHDHWLVHNLFKINGGFEIIRKKSTNEYKFEYRKRSDEEISLDPPIIMLPSREQDYLDPYFRSVFPKAIRLLQESIVLVIIGYSIPEEDALLRFLIRQFAEDKRDIEDRLIFYIDLMEESAQIEKLKSIFKYNEFKN